MQPCSSQACLHGDSFPTGHRRRTGARRPDWAASRVARHCHLASWHCVRNRNSVTTRSPDESEITQAHKKNPFRLMLARKVQKKFAGQLRFLPQRRKTSLNSAQKIFGAAFLVNL